MTSTLRAERLQASAPNLDQAPDGYRPHISVFPDAPFAPPRAAPPVSPEDRLSPGIPAVSRRLTTGAGGSFVAHLLILLALLLIKPLPRLGDVAPEPAAVGFVFAEAPAATSTSPPPEPVTEPPKPATEPAAGEVAVPSEPPGVSVEPPPPLSSVHEAPEGHEAERVTQSKKHTPPARTTHHAKAEAHPKPVRRESLRPPDRSSQTQKRQAPAPKPKPDRNLGSKQARELPVHPASPPQASSPQTLSQPLPKVWTPSAQPTPNALPPTSGAPSQNARAPGPDQAPHIDSGWVSSVSDWLLHHQTETDPRLRHVEGVVVIRFSVRPDGQVVDVSVLRSSGVRGLDQAAVALVRGAHLPPFPPSMVQPMQSVILPISYGLE